MLNKAERVRESEEEMQTGGGESINETVWKTQQAKRWNCTKEKITKKEFVDSSYQCSTFKERKRRGKEADKD